MRGGVFDWRESISTLCREGAYYFSIRKIVWQKEKKV